MTRGRYILAEAAIGAAFSAALSLAFVLLLFGGEARVPVAGMRGMVADAAPQSVMIVLMSSLVPRLLLRHRCRAGRLACAAPPATTAAILLQSIALALAAGAVLVALQAVLLPIATPPAWPLGAVIAYKLCYGAALGAATAGAVVARGLAAAS
jgi:hypothetical protein